MDHMVKRPFTYDKTLREAKEALHQVERLDPELAKPIKDYLAMSKKYEMKLIAALVMLASKVTNLECKLKAIQGFMTHLRNPFGFTLAKSKFEHFYRRHHNANGSWTGYCSLCDTQETENHNEEGRLVSHTVVCAEDCPGVVLGLWPSSNTIE